MNLHSIRFSSVFLRFCFSLKKYALFHPHFYKSISALNRLLYIDKNFVQKFCVWTIRAIFQNRYPFTKKLFRKTFVQYVTVWLVRIWTYKNADEKSHTFSRRSKNVKNRTKTDEKPILCKLTFSNQHGKRYLHKQTSKTKKLNSYKLISDFAESNFAMTSHWKLMSIYSSLYFRNRRCNV